MKPIVQYWHSEEVPAEIEVLLETFREHNPDLRHMVFSESTAERFIAEHFTGRETAAFRACAVPAMQADYLRYCAVLVLGGIYCDADFRCRASLRPLLASEGGEIFRFRFMPVSNCFFAFPSPGHPLLRLAMEIATANIERRLQERVNLVTGPFIFSALKLLKDAGSFEGLRARLTDFDLEPLAQPLVETVGSYERVPEAFAGVRISPMARATEYIAEPEPPPAYKSTGDHWIHVTQGIYRTKSPAEALE